MCWSIRSVYLLLSLHLCRTKLLLSIHNVLQASVLAAFPTLQQGKWNLSRFNSLAPNDPAGRWWSPACSATLENILYPEAALLEHWNQSGREYSLVFFKDCATWRRKERPRRKRTPSLVNHKTEFSILYKMKSLFFPLKITFGWFWGWWQVFVQWILNLFFLNEVEINERRNLCLFQSSLDVNRDSEASA